MKRIKYFGVNVPKETTPLIIETKRIKYLGINRPKETKDIYIIIEHWWKKSKMTQLDGEVYHVTDRKNQYSENEYATQSNL